MKRIFTLLLLGISISAFSQGYQPLGTATATIDVSNIKAAVLTGGDMFQQLPPTPSTFGSSAFEVPRGSGIHSIFNGALWLGGKDSQNNLYVTAQTYRQGNPSDAGYWPGPVASNHNAAHHAKYDKVWKVSKSEILNHIQNYNGPGYVVPNAIASWPGNGNLANGEAAKLAPFIDLNNDGIYDPNAGDYPDIKGDQALYVIFNDKAGVKEPISPAMNVEIHGMYYGFDNPGSGPVYNTLFSEYRIINRGTINFQHFYAGLWLDFELGNWADDYVGCDTTTNRFYVYNGDNFDQDSMNYFNMGAPQTFLVKGYGASPPVQSVAFLDKQMSHFMYYNNNMNPVNGHPSVANDYYNYLRGIWRNGAAVTYGGDGTNQANAPASHMFPGDPVTATGWSERNTLTTPAMNVPYDRRGLGSIGPFNLASGQEIKFTAAYTYSRGTSNLNSVTQSQADAIAVQNYFRSQIMGNPKPNLAKKELVLYPNPASDLLQMQLPGQFTNKPVMLTIVDNTGRSVLQKNLKPSGQTQHLNITSLAKGIYQVSVTSENQTLTSRLVKL